MVFSILSALLLLLQVPVSGANDDFTSLTVDKALEVAYEQNPQINILRYRIKAQEQQEGLALNLADPEISYFKEGIGDDTFMEQRWAITQTLDFPVTSFTRRKREQATTRSLEIQLDALKLQVKADVKASYAQLAYALQSGGLARERVDLFESLRRATEARSNLGEGSGIDAMQAALQLQEARNNMQVASQDIMNARYNLFQTIGLDPEDQTYDIGFPDTLRYVEVNINQDEVMMKLNDHPQLKQIEMEQQAASLNTKTAKSSYLPDLSLSYYRQDFGNDYDFYGFEVGFSIPLWFAAQQSKKVQQAQAHYHAVGWKLEDTRLLIKKQAEQTWHGYETARANIRRFRETIQSQSVELVQMTQRGYRLGELDLLTLLEAQRTYLRTQEAYYQTLREYYLRIIEMEKYLQTDIIFN